MFNPMSMMGGGGVSSGGIGNSQASNQNETDSRNSTAAIQGDGIAYGFGDNAQVTDGGAIAKMGDLAMASLASQIETQNSALKFAYDAGRPEASTWNKTLYVAGGVIALIAIAWVLKK